MSYGEIGYDTAPACADKTDPCVSADLGDAHTRQPAVIRIAATTPMTNFLPDVRIDIAASPFGPCLP
jgi:hypothetical protein